MGVFDLFTKNFCFSIRLNAKFVFNLILEWVGQISIICYIIWLLQNNIKKKKSEIPYPPRRDPDRVADFSDWIQLDKPGL